MIGVNFEKVYLMQVSVSVFFLMHNNKQRNWSLAVE